LQRLSATCKTCGVSETFNSTLNLNLFRLRHMGHEIEEGGANKETPPEWPEANVAQREEKKPLEESGATRVSRVVVDLVVFPALPDPIFRIRGFKDVVELAFVVTSPAHGSEKVRELLASGRFVDHGFSEMLYVWGPEAIEYEEEARARLHLPAEPARQAKTEVVADLRPRDDLQQPKPSTVAGTNRILSDIPRGKAAASRTTVEPLPIPSPAEPARPEASPTVEESDHPSFSGAPIDPDRAQSEAAAAAAHLPQHVQEQAAAVRARAPAPRPSPPREKAREKRVVEKASNEGATLARKEDGDDYLLVSKSWYVQGGMKNMDEAVRVSKVLKTFRWKVEPVYTIGVILDDILSVETSKNQISRKLIQSVENAGYRLAAVTTDQGKLAAWFKKTAFDAPPPPDSADHRGFRTKIAALDESVEDQSQKADEQGDALWQPPPRPSRRDHETGAHASSLAVLEEPQTDAGTM
jgi:hypothetical protein